MKENNKKALLVKILVPALIVVVIAGIYLFKNMPEENIETTPKPKNPDQTAAANNNDEGDDNGSIDYFSSKFDLDATEDFDYDEILSYGLPVLIDLGSDSCYSCLLMAPLLEELNQELRGKAIVKYVNVNKNSAVAIEFPLIGIPTQFFFDKDGKPYVPNQSNEELSAKLQGKQFIMYADENDEHVLTAHPGFMDKDQMLAVLKELGVND